jgi:RNA polymerase sigma-70 factor, ECF subfamily
MISDTSRASAHLDRETDEQLVGRIEAGDRTALAALHARHRALATRVAANVVGVDAAEDVVQEAFMAVWFRAGQFDASRGNVRGWLKGLVRNRAIDALRRVDSERRRHDLAEQDHERRRDAQRDPVPDGVGAAQQAAALREAIEDLPRDQYRVLDLAYYLGLSYASIARVLDCPLGTVKGRARLGLTRLRASLEEPA